MFLRQTAHHHTMDPVSQTMSMTSFVTSETRHKFNSISVSKSTSFDGVEEFGRGVPDFSIGSSDKTIVVHQSILDSVLSEAQSGVLRGLHAVMTIKQLPCTLADTKSYLYSLSFPNKPFAPVATIKTEESTSKDDLLRTKLFAISVVDITRLRGGSSSKSTLVLAAAMGDYKGNQLRLLSDAMPSNSTMDVKLIYDAEMEQQGMFSFMEMGIAIEKQLNPYEQRTQGAKIKLSSAL